MPVISIIALALLPGRHVPRAISEPVIADVSGLPDRFELHLRANGKPCTFFLDSGSYQSFVRPERWGASAVGANLDLAFIDPKQSLGRVSALTKGISPAAGEVDGALGTDFLRGVVILVDPSAGKAAIWNSDSTSERDAQEWAERHPNWSGQTEQFANSTWSAETLSVVASALVGVRASVDGTPRTLALDTGSTDTSLSVTALPPDSQEPLYQAVVSYASTRAKTSFYLVRSIQTSFLQAQLLEVPGIPSSLGVDGTLGLSQLSAGQWILDLRGRSFAFRQYTGNGLLSLDLPGLTFNWKAPHVWLALDTSLFQGAPETSELNLINGKPWHETLRFPAGPTVSQGDFRGFSFELHKLIAHPFTITVSAVGTTKTILVDVSKLASG